MYRNIARGVLVTALLVGTAPPAFALTPGLTDEAPELNELCMAEPALKSGYNAVAINVQQRYVSRTERQVGLPSIKPIGEPQIILGQYHSKHRHSTTNYNYYALQDTTKYWAYADQVTPYSEITTWRYTFDCHVHKSVKGKGNDTLHGTGWSAPEDEQIFGLTSPTFETVRLFSKTSPYGSFRIPGDTIDQLICYGSWSSVFFPTYSNRPPYYGTCSYSEWLSLPVRD